MLTEKEIRIKYKEAHANLEEEYYQNKLMSKEDFDYLHGQNWDNMEAELIDKGYLSVPEPPRDYDAELDELRAKVKVLEKK